MKAHYKSYLDHGAWWNLPAIDRKAVREIDLAPCPLCGVDGEQTISRMVVCQEGHLDSESVIGVWSVVCGNCGLVMPGGALPRTAVEAWNNRPATDGATMEGVVKDGVVKDGAVMEGVTAL